MTELLLFVLLLLFLSGLTSLTEAAFFSISLSKVHLAVEQKRRWAGRLLRVKESLQRPISTVVILNNAINIVGSIYVGQLSVQTFGSDWVGVFSACLTFLVILFAEIVPKTLGDRYCESVALYAVTPVLILTRLLSPLLWLIERIIHPLTHKEGAKAGSSEEEISALAKVANRFGEISPEENELIRRAFRLNDTVAKDIMTHRLELSFLLPELTLGKIELENIQREHSRILVAEDGDLDRIIGVVYLRDLLLALALGKRDATVSSLTHPVTRVYEGTPSHKLLEKFQQTRQHLFVVGDEYGGTSGVVSLEDVLEELVGEIEDENDVPVPPGSEPTEGPARDRKSRAGSTSAPSVKTPSNTGKSSRDTSESESPGDSLRNLSGSSR